MRICEFEPSTIRKKRYSKRGLLLYQSLLLFGSELTDEELRECFEEHPMDFYEWWISGKHYSETI